MLFQVVRLLLNFFSFLTRNAIDETIELISSFFPEIRGYIDNGTINMAILILAGIVGIIAARDMDFMNNLQQSIKLIIKTLQPKRIQIITIIVGREIMISA